ncbi:MAG: M48 family metalloprotease [Isosphaeraceae bacterium]
MRSSPYAWAGLLLALATLYAVARLGSGLAMAVASWPLRRYRGDEWTERARRAWPVRKTSSLALLLLGLPAGLLLVTPSGLQPVPFPFPMVLGSAVAIVGILQSSIAAERTFNPAYALTPRPAWGVWISWMLVCVPIVLLMTAFASVLPDRMNGIAAAELVLLALIAGLYLGWGRLAALRLLRVIRPAPQRVRAVAERAASEAGVPLRGVEQVALPLANAFAFILDRKIGFTDAAAAVLDDEELAAVCAHELAHLAEPRPVQWARVSQSFLLGFFLAMLAGATKPLLGSYGLMGLCLGWLVGCVVLIVGLRLLQRLILKMEHLADARGVGSQAAPGVYARALEKIHRTSLIPAVMPSKRLTHPHLYDRIIEAGVQPDYPRPAPPGRWASLGGFACLLVAAFAGVQGVRYTASVLPGQILDRESAAFWRSGAGLADGSDLLLLFRISEGRPTPGSVPGTGDLGDR